MTVIKHPNSPNVTPGVIEWKDLDLKKFYILSPVTALATRLILYPNLVVKTRLQVQFKNSLYSGTFDAYQKILRTEGARGLYKGFLPYSFSVVAQQCYISSYEYLRSRLAGTVSHEISRNFLAGAFSSLISQVIVVPVDIVSQRMMMQSQLKKLSKAEYAGMTSVLQTIFHTQGMVGFFKGYGASVCTAAPSSAIWWATYGMLRRVQLKGQYVTDSLTWTLLQQAGSGAGAGVVAAVTTNPLDVIRAQLQVFGVKGQTMLFTVKKLHREEGYRGFMKGVTARILHSIQASILLIVAYETVKTYSLKT